MKIFHCPLEKIRNIMQGLQRNKDLCTSAYEELGLSWQILWVHTFGFFASRTLETAEFRFKLDSERALFPVADSQKSCWRSNYKKQMMSFW